MRGVFAAAAAASTVTAKLLVNLGLVRAGQTGWIEWMRKPGGGLADDGETGTGPAPKNTTLPLLLAFGLLRQRGRLCCNRAKH